MKQRHTLGLLFAVAAVPAIATAQSNVTVYGIVDATVRHQRNATGLSLGLRHRF
jgi:predicted porin